MRTLVRFLAILLLFVAPSGTRAGQSLDEAKVQETITRQLEAMRAGDIDAAFARAAPSIQAMFQSPQNFMRMVQQGFPQIMQSRAHRFLKLDSDNGVYAQRVLIDSEAGTVVARYELIEVDGEWRISSCVLEKSEGA